jgi:hypothetical protein
MTTVEKKWAKYDLSGDGDLTQDELDRAKVLLDLELKEEKARAHKKMAQFSMILIVSYIVLIITPVIPDARADLLASMSDIFFITMGSVVGMFMGATAYMSRK